MSYRPNQPAPTKRQQFIADCVLWVFSLSMIAVIFLLAGCATKTTTAPEPVVITKDVPVIVQVKCKDQRQPAPAYPDTDEAIAAIPDDDIFRLGQVFRAGRDLRIARLAADDVQIKACAGE